MCNETATTEICALSLHDALPILSRPVEKPWAIARVSPSTSITSRPVSPSDSIDSPSANWSGRIPIPDRKSTRLNSSHANISYAVFCLKKKIHTSHYTDDEAYQEL